MRKTKTTLAYEKLKLLFQQEALDKNRCIPTAEIAERVNFGRAPVLDALRKLEAEGYLAIVPQKGIVVLEMTIHDMREINDIRTALESFIVKQIAAGFSPEDAQCAYIEIEEQKKAAESNDPQRFINSDERLHLFLSELTQNNRMIHLMQNLRSRFFTAGLYVLKRPGRMPTTINEHTAIIDALIKNDGEEAAKAMIAHLHNGRSLMF